MEIVPLHDSNSFNQAPFIYNEYEIKIASMR